jgi:hypothetical protein
MRLYYWPHHYQCICEDCVKELMATELGRDGKGLIKTAMIEIYEGTCRVCG